MNRRAWIGRSLVLLAVVGTGVYPAAWKYASVQEADAVSATQPEPMESVAAAVASERVHRPTTTSIGTIPRCARSACATSSPGTVRQVALAPGQIIDAAAILVALDVSVEEAELKAQRATEKHDSFDPANNVVPESTIVRTVKASTISPT